MTEVNRYRDGELSSTALMQEAMEKAHQVGEGEGKKLDWHKDHESMDQARARMHDEPANVMKYVAAGVVVLDVGKIAKDVYKAAPHLLNTPAQFAKEEVISTAKSVVTLAEATYTTRFLIALGAAAAAAEVIHAFGQGDELSHRADVDALDVTVTNLLDLDPSFKSAEWKKYPGISSDRTMALFKDDYGKMTEFGRTHIPELQAAADAGAQAALDARQNGGFDSYLASRPDVQQRCRDDIAFSKGFENVRYISTHRHDAAAALNALEARIQERDARSNAGVQVRG
jgi:hypothetical protein